MTRREKQIMRKLRFLLGYRPCNCIYNEFPEVYHKIHSSTLPQEHTGVLSFRYIR